MTTPDLQALIEQLELAAKGCEDYSSDQCATLIDGIGWIAARHMLNKAADALRQTAPTLPGAGGGDALDAARYRWLRDERNPITTHIEHWRDDLDRYVLVAGDEADRVIDAALPPQQGG